MLNETTRHKRKNNVWLYSYEISRISKFIEAENRGYFLAVVQSRNHVQFFSTLWIAACQAPLSSTISWSFLTFMSMSQWWYLTISSSVATFSCHQSFPASGSYESALYIRWPKYWSFSFHTSPSKEYSGLISFRTGWFDLIVVLGTLKSLLQHHGSKASVLQHSAFFMVQLSHPYMTTGKTIALTIWIFVNKVISLLFNMLSRLLGTRIEGSGELLFNGYWVSVWVIEEFWK